MPQQATHRFVARTKRFDILAGVVVMSVPTAFSKLLGDYTPKLERLISRGASISWAPKNLASWLITRSIGWMAHQFRLFIGYSDPEAKEVGRVYQACNFMFLGHDYGTTVLYCDPERPDEWFTDRHVRHRTAYQKYAAEAGIPWKDEWVEGHRLVWERIPPGFAAILKRKEEEYKSRCIERTAAPKGKYAYDLTEDHLLVTGAPRRGRGGPHPLMSSEVERRRCRRGSPLSCLTKIGRTSGGGCRLRGEGSRGVLRPSILRSVRAAAPRAPTPAWPPPPASPP